MVMILYLRKRDGGKLRVPLPFAYKEGSAEGDDDRPVGGAVIDAMIEDLNER